jgi:hypothetical protein
MYGYSFGCAKADVWHITHSEHMLYPGYDTVGTLWSGGAGSWRRQEFCRWVTSALSVTWHRLGKAKLCFVGISQWNMVGDIELARRPQ